MSLKNNEKYENNEINNENFEKYDINPQSWAMFLMLAKLIFSGSLEEVLVTTKNLMPDIRIEMLIAYFQN